MAGLESRRKGRSFYKNVLVIPNAVKDLLK